MGMHQFLLYIDPGTGSMLFTIILGVVTTGIFLVRGLIIKFKYKMSGGKVKTADTTKKKFTIFSDSKRYWNVFEPICDEFENRGVECTYMTASSDDPALTKEYEYVKCEFIGEGNKAFARLNTMSATICLSTTPGLDVLQWKRSKDVDYYVHTFHTVDDGTVYRMFGIDYYDAVLLNGKIQENPLREIEQLRGIKPKETVLVGATQLDSMKKRFESMDHQKGNGALTVLCAPSWGESSILNRYGEKFIDSLIATGYKIVIRPHPQSKISETQLLENLQKKYPESEKLSWNFDNDNFEVLDKADILITDFSGVVFDYTFIFDRPIIYADTSFDKSPYDAAWIEGMPWSLEVLEKLGAQLKEEDFPRIKEIIDGVLNSDEYREGRIQARKMAWEYQGEAAKRTVDYLMDKYRQLVEDRDLEN